MSSSITPALIIGRPNANMLAQARALGRCGIPVYCLIHRGESSLIVKLSRYVVGVVVTKFGRDDEVATLIKELCEREKIKPVVFYGGDADISLIHRIWDEIKNIVICATDPVRADYLNDKSVQVSILKQAGIRVPDSWCISSVSDALRYREHFNFPVICRPVELSRRGGIAEKYFIAEDGDALLDWANSIFSADRPEILIQEYIHGATETIYFSLVACDDTGRVTGIVCGRKVFEYPQGLMCIGETVQNQAFRKLCIRAYSELCIGGVLGIEFKWDEKTNDFVFIEVNLRPENILAIAMAAGINLMELAYQQASNGNVGVLVQDYEKAIWRDSSLVLLSRMFGEKAPKLNTSGVVVVDAYQAFDDPLPALVWYAIKVWRLFGKIARRSRLYHR